MAKKTPVVPAVEVPPTLAKLSQRWLNAKEDEQTAKDRRLAVEEQITAMVTGEIEGTANAQDGEYKVKVTRKLTRTLDIDAYLAVKAQIPISVDPVIYKPDLDLKKLRAIETANPDLYKVCTAFITVKPAKASVKIEMEVVR